MERKSHIVYRNKTHKKSEVLKQLKIAINNLKMRQSKTNKFIPKPEVTEKINKFLEQRNNEIELEVEEMLIKDGIIPNSN